MHLSGPAQPEDADRARAGRRRDSGGAAATRNGAVERFGRPSGPRLDLAQHRRGLERHASRPQAEAASDLGHQPSDDRMQMEMLVRVAMIEGQAGGAERRELGGDFGRELAPRLPAEGDDGSEGRHVGAKHAARHPPDAVTAEAGSSGRPSISTRCKPTRRDGMRRARATASAAAGADTIRLAAVRMPPRCAASTASLTSRAAPKSSAVTISRFKRRPAGCAGSGRTPRPRAAGASSCRGSRPSPPRSRRSWRDGNRISCRSPRPNRRSRCGSGADS